MKYIFSTELDIQTLRCAIDSYHKATEDFNTFEVFHDFTPLNESISYELTDAEMRLLHPYF